MGSRWTLPEEKFIAKCIGTVPVKRIAESLGRSYAATRTHIHEMRVEGRLNASSQVDWTRTFASSMRTCPSCGIRRSSFTRGVCRACYVRSLAEANKARADRAYEMLPAEVKKTFRLYSSLHIDSKVKKPTLEGLDRFDADAATERYLEEIERRDIDAAVRENNAYRQRVCRCKRALNAWRRRNGLDEL